MAYGGGGNGEIDPDPTDPENPPQPTILTCFDNFNYEAPVPYAYRMCYDEGPQRGPGSACVNEFSCYFPSTSKTCLVLGSIVDPQ